jgi:hypothetical protein
MCNMSYDIEPRINEGLKKIIRVVILVNDAYKTLDCGIPNEELQSRNI